MSTIVLVVPVALVTVSQGRAVATATVTNSGAAAEDVVLGVFAPPATAAGVPAATAAGWTSVERPQRTIQPGATEQFTLTFEVPAGLAAGTYPVRLIAYSAHGAPEESADQARQVDVVVPVAAPVTPAPRARWWIWAVAAALVLVVGVVAFLVLRPEPDPCADGSCPSPSPTPVVPQPVVEGIDWELASMREGDIATLPNPAKITLRVDGGEVSGQAGCNTYRGTWQRPADTTVQISQPIFTIKKCLPLQVGVKANRFRSILPHVTTLASDGDTLELITDDNRSLFFTRA